MPFRIEISKNRLACKISWEKTSDDKNIPSRQDLANLIESKAIKDVDPAVIDKAYGKFVKKGKLKDFLLAEGVPPAPSKDGKVEWLFDTKSEEIHAGKVEKTGSINYRERRSFVGVDKDQLIGTWTPPEPGEPGVDVFGELVQPLKPKENNILAGTNVRLSDDGTESFSTIKGHVFASGCKVGVDKVYNVEGDVDFHTGNIHYPGNVLVSGNVRERFVVEAEGDVVIDGIVENAEVRATGNIVVKKGIIRNSRVILGGDLQAEFIQDSYVECGGKVLVKKSIVKGIVNANRDVEVASMHGSNGIVGGMVNAGYDISAYCVGTELGVQTKVCAGRDSKLFMRYRKLVSYGLKAKANVKRFERILELMKTRYDKKMSNMEIRKMKKAEKALAEQQQELNSVISGLNEVKLEADKFIAAKVQIFGTAHEGAEISIWGIMTRLNKSVKNSVFFFDNENNVVAYKPLN